MIKIKTHEEIQIMQKSGAIASKALKEVLRHVKVGVSLIELDKVIEQEILKNGGEPSFKTVAGYSYSSCINVNEGIVHGIPSDYNIKSGDIVSIDLGALYKGYHSDLSYTLEVGTNRHTKFLDIGKKALKEAISKCIPGNTLGDVSYAMQHIVEKSGYTVSRDLVGHGIGTDLHEDPYIPCYGKKGAGIKIKEGMVFAIEIIYQMGSHELVLKEDNWTLETADGSLSALFENTVAITKSSNLLLTSFN